MAPRFHPNQYPIIEGLIKKGHSVVFCVTKIGPTEKHNGVTIELLNPNRFTTFLAKKWKKKGDDYLEDKLVFWFCPTNKAIKEILAKYKPDVIIMRDRYLNSLKFYRQAKKNRIKCILYNQSPIYIEKHGILRNLVEKIWFSFFPKVRISVCNYEEFPRSGVKYVKDPNAYFMPHVPRQIIDSRSFFQNGIINIFDCGKYRPYKNHFCLVDAISIIKNRTVFNNFHVTIVGQAISKEEQDYFNRLNDYIKEKDLSTFFTLLNCVPYDDIPSFYLSCDLFILPSLTEQATVSILDSMSFGLATISTSKNGTADYIEPDKTGQIFNTNDPEDLANKIIIYLEKPDLIVEHGSQALREVKCNYSFDSYYKKLIRILEK